MCTQLWSLSAKTIAWRYSLAIRQSNTRPFFFPAATKHVTILLCPVLGALSKDDRRSHLFSQGECFNYSVASSLNTSVQVSVQSSGFFVVENSLKKKRKKNLLIVRQRNIVMQNLCIWGHPHPPFFFYLWQVMCCHYSCSLSHFFKSPWHQFFDI